MPKLIRKKKKYLSEVKRKQFARFVSNIFIPPFFFLVCVIFLVSKSNDVAEIKIVAVILSIVIGAVLPIWFVLRSIKRKTISNIDAEKKEERNKPYLIGFGLFFSGFLIAKIFHLPNELQLFYLLFVVNLILISVINKFWKISAHSQGAAISLGLTLFYESNYFYFLLPIVLIVMWSRYELKVHTVLQIIAGFLLGIFATHFTAKYLSEFFYV